MDPFSTAFITAIVAAAGSEIGKRLIGEIWPQFKAEGKEQVLEKLEHNPTPQDTRQAEEQLAASLQKNPVLATQVRNALNTELENNPTFTERLRQSNPNFFKRWGIYGYSDEHEVWQGRMKCPIGGEFVWIPRFVDAQGNEVSWDSVVFGKRSRVLTAECKQGHKWLVYKKNV